MLSSVCWSSTKKYHQHLMKK